MDTVLDVIGTLAFAVSGASLARKQRLDVIGALALALTTGLAGGIIRDLLVGDVPPIAIREEERLLIPFAAAVLVIVAPRLVWSVRRPIIIFDAIGLGLFAVVGSAKAIDSGLGVIAATLIGTISAVGGGIIRDVFVDRIPETFTPASGLYVIPAAIGAAIVGSLETSFELSSAASAGVAIGAAALVVAVRLGSIHFGWRTARLSPLEAPTER